MMLKKKIKIGRHADRARIHVLIIYILLVILVKVKVLFYDEIQNQNIRSFAYVLVIVLMLIVLLVKIKEISHLLDSYERQNDLLQNSFDVLEHINLFIIDLDYNYLYMNQSDIRFMENYFQISPAVGENVSRYLSESHFQSLKDNVQLAIKNGLQTSEDTFDFGGERIVLYTSYSPVKNNKGDICAICCITTNITETVAEKDRFMELVYQDPLTEIYNRRKLQDYYQEVVQKDNLKTWIFIFDLDNFKLSNDSYGHSVGDQILIDFSAILKSEFPDTAVVARIGGDEFCVLLPEISSQDVLHIQSNIVMRMHELEPYGVTVSIGKTLAKNTAVNDLNHYIQKADKKMYIHKYSHKSGQTEHSLPLN